MALDLSKRLTLSVAETCEAFGVCRATYYNKLDDQLESGFIGNRRRITVRSVEALLQRMIAVPRKPRKPRK